MGFDTEGDSVMGCKGLGKGDVQRAQVPRHVRVQNAGRDVMLGALGTVCRTDVAQQEAGRTCTTLGCDKRLRMAISRTKASVGCGCGWAAGEQRTVDGEL